MLLVLLVVLVAGLLRSHAEILRRVGPPRGSRRRELRRFDRASAQPGARDSGTAGHPGGRPRRTGARRSARPTLLAFLTSGCSACAVFWETLGEAAATGGD